MKKLIFASLCLAALVGCQDNKSKVDSAASAERDSLNKVIEQKDNEINDIMATFNQIEEGLKEISQAEGRISVARAGEGSSKNQRIAENMQFIQQTMQQNRELINKLKTQLRESTVNGEQLKKTIENLALQLEEKDKELMKLRAELDAKDIHIMDLDEKIANLNTNVNNLSEQNAQKTATINAQDKQLNSAWFVFGTKKELKEQHIMENGKVLQSNFNKNYFAKIDIRIDKEIKFYSKSARILTMHPSGSYTLTPDVNKQYVLRITNPQLFWSTSKYLVVLVK